MIVTLATYVVWVALYTTDTIIGECTIDVNSYYTHCTIFKKKAFGYIGTDFIDVVDEHGNIYLLTPKGVKK